MGNQTQVVYNLSTLTRSFPVTEAASAFFEPITERGGLPQTGVHTDRQTDVHEQISIGKEQQRY